MINFREVSTDDAEKLAKIYKYYVENTAITFEITPPDETEFKKRIENITKKYPYLVAETNGEIIGYCYVNSLKPREAYDISVEISIYIKKEFHNRKIGSRFFELIEEKLKKTEIKNIYACVAYTEKEDKYLTNKSVIFHKKMGFSKVGLLNNCGKKFNNFYSIMWMEKKIN